MHTDLGATQLTGCNRLIFSNVAHVSITYSPYIHAWLHSNDRDMASALSLTFKHRQYE